MKQSCLIFKSVKQIKINTDISDRLCETDYISNVGKKLMKKVINKLKLVGSVAVW